jgi:hypothetical protein
MGEEKDAAYNILAEHLFSQVDREGKQHRLFKVILSHRKNKNALEKEDQFRVNKYGRRIQKRSTAG